MQEPSILSYSVLIIDTATLDTSISPLSRKEQEPRKAHHQKVTFSSTRHIVAWRLLLATEQTLTWPCLDDDALLR